MISFIIIMLMAIALAIIVLAILGTGGAAFMILYGDIVICVAIIVWIVVRLVKRRQNK